MKFDRKIGKSQSRFTLIEESRTQQCSYNLNIELEKYLLDNNMIAVEKHLSVSNHVAYFLYSDVKIILGDNILYLIGEKYRNVTNEVVFIHTEDQSGVSNKFQLKTTEFKSRLNKSELYNWFIKLYEMNIEGSTFRTFVDAANRTIKFDVFIIKSDYDNNSNYDSSTTGESNPNKKFDLNIKGSAKNLIISGTPGCGKSYYLQNKILKSYNLNNVIRTTFFQDYSNTDFVGQILPTIKTEDGKDIVEYVFNPGPFSLALYKAITNPTENVALVIEELNRGNAASIFGDLFQLLDRNDDGISQYPITNVNIQKWLNKEISTELNEIKIPGNLSIYATMNTSDQNVFTLDSAFKRRWNYEKLQNVFNDHPYATAEIPELETTWKKLVENINNTILTSDEFLNSEDKQLGVYFIDEKGVKNLTVDEYKEQARKEFAHKLFGYLWDDVAKFNRQEWFGEVKSLDELINNYLSGKGTEVFKNGIFNKNK